MLITGSITPVSTGRRPVRSGALSRGRCCRAFAVARPPRQSNASSVSYTDLIQAHKRTLGGPPDPASSSLQLSDNPRTNSSHAAVQDLPAARTSFFSSRDDMLRQIQGMFGQVFTVSKQAVDEITAAIGPQQRSYSSSSLGSDPLLQPAAATVSELQPQPLKAVAQQATRLGKAIAEDVHGATQDAYHRYGPHLTAAGVRLVGKTAAAVGVEVIGKDNTARAIGQLGSTNAAAATEQLGVGGVAKVSRRLGPVGLYKILVKLGPRGILNMASHISAYAADQVRAQARRLNPDPQQYQPEQQQQQQQLQGQQQWGADVPQQVGGDGGGVGGRRRGVLPVVALGAAMLQVLLAAVAGMLQSASNLLQSGVRLWDRVHSHDKTARSRDDAESEGAADAAAAEAGSSNAAASLIVREGY